MSEHSEHPELDNEHRYLALLALTSQELPQASLQAESTALHSAQSASEFERLDADPAALQGFLERERKRRRTARSSIQQPSFAIGEWLTGLARSIFATPTVRYASAFSAAAVIAVLIFGRVSVGDLGGAIEQSYAAAGVDGAQSSIVLPWERPSSAIGFAPAAANDSHAAIEFGWGLARGKEFAAHGARDARFERKDESAYAALGEWNYFLSVACAAATQLPEGFWRAQRDLGGKLARAAYSERASATMVAEHLTTVNTLLSAIDSEASKARNVRALGDELLRFRERFAPTDPAFIASGTNGRP